MKLLTLIILLKCSAGKHWVLFNRYTHQNRAKFTPSWQQHPVVYPTRQWQKLLSGPRNLTRSPGYRHGLQIPEHPWALLEKAQSMEAPCRSPQDPKDPLPTPRCQRPGQPQRSCLRAFLGQAMSEPLWGRHWLDLSQEVTLMLNLIGIWGSWRPGWHLGPFISSLCGVSGHIVLLGHCHEGVNLVCSCVLWVVCVKGPKTSL